MKKKVDSLKLDLGQHLLKDQEVVKTIVQLVPPGKKIIEIGAGTGILTKPLLKKSKKVIAIEIDPNFEEELLELKQRFANLRVIFGNALDELDKKNFSKLLRPEQEVWLVGSLPYHITEPLMMKLPRLSFKTAVFLVGIRFVNEIRAEHNISDFGKLTLLVNTFYHWEFVKPVEKKCFYPPPKTLSAIIKLFPRSEDEFEDNMERYLWRQLFLSTTQGTLVKNALRKGLVKFSKLKKEQNTLTKNEAREIVAELDVPADILDKSVEQLNNQEFRVLAIKLNANQSR